MGLPCQVNDFSNESNFLFSIIAGFFCYFRWQIYFMFNSLKFRFKWPFHRDNVVVAAVVVTESDLGDSALVDQPLRLSPDHPSSGSESGLDEDHEEDNVWPWGWWGYITFLDPQLILNRLSCEVYGMDDGGEPSGSSSDSSSCVVCLSPLRKGDQVRRLVCGHVFHKQCFDGWLDHFNLNCPLCRTPVMSKEALVEAHRKAK